MSSIRDMIDSGDGFEVDLSHGVTARINGADTEVFAEKTVVAKDGTSEVKHELIATFVPWIPVTHEAHAVSRDGHTRPTSETRFYPEVITRHGTFRAPNPVSESVAFSIKKIRSLLHRAGLVLPLDARGIAQLENVLSELGAHDGSRDTRIAYEAMGWAHIDGQWTYVAPRGGVTTDGIVELAVTSPGNDDDSDALPAVLGEIGFDRVVSGDELRSAAGAIRAFQDMMIADHSAPYLLLGTVFSSVLPHPTQTVLDVVGRTGSGKTNVARAALGFLSTARKVTADLTSKPSLVGLQARAAWSRHGLCLWDDYRAESAQNDPEMRKNASSLIQMHLTGDDAAKSNKNRGTGKSNPVQCFGILTSEQIVDGGEGIANRLLVTEVAKGDVLLEPKGSSPYDRWNHDYEDSGLARALMASYLQFIAEQIERAGSLRAFEREVAERRGQLLDRLPTSRTLTSAAMILVGWEFLFDFAEQAGFDDLLPEYDEIEAAILAGANAADVAASEANTARRLIERTRDKIAAGAAFVGAEGLTQPKSWDALGWEKVRGSIQPRTRANVGIITPDEQWIVVGRNWLIDLAKEMGITTSQAALNALLLELPFVHPDSAKEKPSATFGFRSRPRGVYVRADVLAPDLRLPSTKPVEADADY